MEQTKAYTTFILDNFLEEEGFVWISEDRDGMRWEKEHFRERDRNGGNMH